MDSFQCWDCGNDIELDNPKMIEAVKKTKLKTVDGTYLLICEKCAEEPDPY